ncbi:DUF4363 family protein [Candidatus Formimonas warabiya]|uniref:DUF4363 family protein n=1 Tax=Formimonas warabiya TaxID=1761012 RepID=A0A3G1KMX3_FORW1|nr:DUF4363 family protein [Candidatus Formimonas warabiya]ATW23831.1 hypothetical protein DCMF_02580 [Candidatus Formimonas warabiya]
MKYYLSLLVLFLLTLFLGFFTIHFLSDSTEKITSNFDRITVAVDRQDWVTAEKQFSLTKEQWEKYKKWWAIVIDHKEIDNIDTSITRTDQYLRHHNQVLSAGELSVLNQYLKHIPETEKISWKNIF